MATKQSVKNDTNCEEIDPDLIYCDRCGKQIKNINSGWGVCPACGDGEGTTLCEQCAGGWTEYAGDNDKHSYCVCDRCSIEIKQGKKKIPTDQLPEAKVNL